MFGSGERIARLEERVRRQERLIEELCRRVGVDPAGMGIAAGLGIDAEERRLILEGKKIHAIKHYRERTGAGLREAKDAIEAAARG